MPPLAVIVKLPSLPGTQVGCVVAMVVIVSGVGCVIIKVVVILHPLISVAVIVYVFGPKPLKLPLVLFWFVG